MQHQVELELELESESMSSTSPFASLYDRPFSSMSSLSLASFFAFLFASFAFLFLFFSLFFFFSSSAHLRAPSSPPY